MLEKQEKRQIRHKRIRAKVRGTKTMPRLCVFKSSRHIYAQLVDDERGGTLAVAKDSEIKGASPGSEKEKTASQRTGKAAVAFEVGKLIADKSKKIKIEKVIFDRGGYSYHGRIKSLAEGAREGGLKF